VGVYQVPGVEGLYFGADAGQTTHLWTVVGQDDPALRERIYQLEAQLYDKFPGARLDFFVLTKARLKDGGQGYTLPDGFCLTLRRYEQALPTLEDVFVRLAGRE